MTIKPERLDKFMTDTIQVPDKQITPTDKQIEDGVKLLKQVIDH